MSKRYLRARHIAARTAVICVLAAAAAPVFGQAAPPAEAPPAEAPPAEAPPAEAPPAEAPPAEAPPAEIPAAEPEPERSVATGIRGRVIDAKSGEAMIEGQVQIVGRAEKSLTDIDGNFSIELPPGRYTLRSFYELYKVARVENIEVSKGSFTDVEIKLEPEALEDVTDEVIVTARADTATEATQLQIRRDSTSVRDAVSAQEIKRSAASNAADAVRRVVAATVDDDARLIVRGLGGRYTRVLLHGVPVPNTDPDEPGVQLDLFPAGVLSNIAVLKTFSPESPGDFAGGVMNVETRDFPSEFLAQANVSLGYNSEATFQDLWNYEGGKYDFLTFDDGSRDIPASLRKVSLQGQQRDFLGRPVGEGGLDSAAYRRASDGFDADWTLTSDKGTPWLNLGGLVGDTVEVGNKDVGYLASVGYSYKELDDSLDAREVSSEGAVIDRWRDEVGTRSATLGGLGTASLELTENSDLTWTTLWSRAASDEAHFQVGYNLDETDYAKRILYYKQRQLIFNLLRGEHRGLPLFAGTDIRWSLNASLATRDEPDRKTATYREQTDGSYRWSNTGQAGEHYYSELEDKSIGGRLDIHMPIVKEFALNLGGATQYTEREFLARRFIYGRCASGDVNSGICDRQFPAELQTLGPQVLFADAAVGDYVKLEEATKGTDGYSGNTLLLAGYGAIDTSLLDPVRVTGGARVESLHQEVTAENPFAEMVDGKTTSRDDVDVLPSAGLIFSLTDDMFLRLAYGGTVARPQFREIAPVIYDDPAERRSIEGQADLERSYIHNADVRWEWFFGQTDLLAVSAFYKYFEQPIELGRSGASSTYTFFNRDSAQVFGGELEARAGLDRFAKLLDGFSLGLNLTIADSKIEDTKLQKREQFSTNSNRPLEGQSPYVINLSLGFSKDDPGLSAFLYYNVFGERLVAVGGQGVDDTYQEPFHSLDLIASWAIDDHWTLQGSAKNLLFQDDESTIDGKSVRKSVPGITANVGAALTY